MNITRNTYASAGIAAIVLGGVLTAQADVKVVSIVEVTKNTTPISRTVTVYLKNERARLETGTGDKIALYDYKAGKLFILNSSTKTYYEKAIPKPGESKALLRRLFPFVRIDIKGSVRPAANGSTQNVAGIATKSYSLNTNVKIQPKKSVYGGGRRGGGAGDQGMEIHAEGDFQGADISAVIPGTSADRLLLFTQQIMNSEIAAGPLASDFLELKVIPVKGKVTVTRSGGRPSQGKGRAGHSGLSLHSSPVTIAVEVTALEKNTILDSSLFAVPSGYQRIDAPQHGMGEFARLGGFGGE